MTRRLGNESNLQAGSKSMNTLLIRPIAHVDEKAQLDPGWTDSDIAAIVEEFLRAQLDPGMKAQLDPGITTKDQVDPGTQTSSQIDPGGRTRTQIDPGRPGPGDRMP